MSAAIAVQFEWQSISVPRIPPLTKPSNASCSGRGCHSATTVPSPASKLRIRRPSSFRRPAPEAPALRREPLLQRLAVHGGV